MKSVDELAELRTDMRILRRKIDRLRKLLLAGEESLKGDRFVGHVRQQIVLTPREPQPVTQSFLSELERHNGHGEWEVV